jgi:hypothetical protein
MYQHLTKHIKHVILIIESEMRVKKFTLEKV